MAYSPCSILPSALLGQFTHKETKCRFEYQAAPANEWLAGQDFPHQIFVGPMAEETRYAKVLKTVAYVVVDEDASGNPVVEKWPVKQEWCRA